jgi:aminoglycoside 3-N-acetyltransferase I
MHNLSIIKPGVDEFELFIQLIRVFEDVFEMENFKLPDSNHLKKLLQDEDFIVVAALSDHVVVGGLTAYTLHQYYSVKPLVYIYDLAVKTEYQRQGIGKQLINHLNNWCKNKGVEEVFVQADLVDDHAIDFYRSTGARSEDVVHFYYPLT